jgi:hypothetical protein
MEHWPHWTTPKQRRHAAEAWAALVSGATDIPSGRDACSVEPPTMEADHALASGGEGPARFVSPRPPYHCACGNPCDTTHRRNNDELMCADCAQDESNRENRWSE